MALALVTRIPNYMEAQIAAGALRSAGIEAQVFDSAFGAIEAPVIEGLGGYRLMAPEEQVADARETLRLLRGTPGLSTGDDDGPWSDAPRSRSNDPRRRGMQVIAAVLLFSPFLIWVLAKLLR